MTIEGKKKYVNENFLKNRKRLAELQKQNPGHLFTVDRDITDPIYAEIKRDKRLNTAATAAGIASGFAGAGAVAMLTQNYGSLAVGGAVATNMAIDGYKATNKYLDMYGETKLDEIAIKGYESLGKSKRRKSK